MIKIAAFAVVAMTAIGVRTSALAATVFENWSEKTAIVRIDANGGRGSISAVPEKGEKRGRSLGTFGKKYSDLSKVKLGFNEGRLVVDTSDCDLTKPKAFIRLQFKMPLKDLPNGSKVDFIAEMKAPPGARWKLGHNGSFSEESAPMDSLKQSKKTHYWNVRQFVSGDAVVKPYVYSHLVPVGLKSLAFDIRLETCGVFEFGRISWAVSKDTSVTVDPKKNLVVNGGAERGWYGTAMANTITYSETGKYLGQDGHWFTTSTEPAIDTVEKHSGRASFRFRVDHDRESIPGWGPYNMELHQVPAVSGKPLVFTCWAKADRKGRTMSLRIKSFGGGSYCQPLKLTTEWKRYRLVVNSVGQKQKGSYGNLDPAPLGLVMPRLDFISPGTFWVDDCAVFQAEDGDYSLEPICVSGTINKDSAIYYAGEKIAAKLKIRRGSEDARYANVKVSSTALDFKGEVVAKTAGRVLPIKSDAVEISEELKLPAGFRGPVQWLFTVSGDDGKTEQEAGFNFGVIDARKPILKRFGYNVHADANMTRLIELMKDFRIGSVRLWDSRINPDGNIAKIHDFHKNGIDVLYCFANAGVLPRDKRYLVVKDPTEWQNRIAYIVTNALGKVCAYEILNEPNARSGMGRNPDPEKYDLLTPEIDAWCIKVAAETIRKYDKKTLIAGPTTCHTDLGWTFDVLGRGAAKYLDIISEHPYCAMPEVPDYSKQVKRLIAEGSRMKGRHMPSWATERGKQTPSNPVHGRIYPADAMGASKVVRTMIVSFAGGSERFFDFKLTTFNPMFHYISVHNGTPDNGYMARPGCILYAERALMDLIEDSPCVKEIPVGVSSRAYVFDRGDKRIVAMWKFLGESRKVKLPGKATVYGFMGARSETDEITLDAYPQYLVTEDSPDQIGKLFATLDFGEESAAASEKREQLKVPYFEKEVDWSSSAVVVGRKADPCAKPGSRASFSGEPKHGDTLEARLAWNRSGLMMRVVVEKDGFFPAAESVMTLWKGDGLQIAFDTMKNAQKVTTGYDDEDFEYDLAMYRGKPTVFRRKASLAYHDSLHKPLGVVEDVAFAVEHHGRQTVYTIKFAPQSISPFRLDKGESMRFAVLANLADGKTRYGALETAPGILVRKKWPYGFQEIVLTDEPK